MVRATKQLTFGQFVFLVGLLELCQFRLTDFVIERSCRMSCLVFGTDFYGCKLVMPAYRELLQRSSDYSSFLTSSEFE